MASFCKMSRMGRGGALWRGLARGLGFVWKSAVVRARGDANADVAEAQRKPQRRRKGGTFGEAEGGV